MHKLVPLFFLIAATALVLAAGGPETVVLTRGESAEFNSATYVLAEFSLDGSRVALKITRGETMEPFVILEEGVARDLRTFGARVSLQRVFEEEGERKAELAFEQLSQTETTPKQISEEEAKAVFLEAFPEYRHGSIEARSCSPYYYCVTGWMRVVNTAGEIQTEDGTLKISNYSFLNGRIAWISKSGGELTRVLATN
ncbi:hypothetical protein AUJ65_06525 [Candidatus Micrarchaeota archaeon CG1_02_51_15]|nr:MAG: hypothetical protein AUJ65_06525 [Candidatus Micrarchaeota archaeon CG1_02_51_15]